MVLGAWEALGADPELSPGINSLHYLNQPLDAQMRNGQLFATEMSVIACYAAVL